MIGDLGLARSYTVKVKFMPDANQYVASLMTCIPVSAMPVVSSVWHNPGLPNNRSLAECE